MKVKTAKVLSVLVSVLVLFASCGQMSDAGGETEITVSLPHVGGTSSRAIDPGKKGDLINETKWYRVHMNDRVLEGSGGNFSASFAVGLKLDIYVECLNSNRDVIVRTITKSITVGSRENNVNFNLMTEGNAIIPPVSPPSPPAPPSPVQGQVTYNGNGANGGITPNDPASHDVGSDVSLQAGEPTRSGYTFAGWTADKELKYTNAGQEQTIPAGTEFASTSSNTSANIKTDTFKMPEGGVVLTAKWSELSTLYVSAAGSDTNNGEYASPLTIKKAFEIASASSTAKTIEVQSNISGVAITQTGGNITLNLGGNTLTGDSSSPVITIASGQLTLEDSGGGKITGGGQGVKVGGGATFIMAGGEISGNTTQSSGAGVFVESSGTFRMEGGSSIKNNTARWYGGGVYVEVDARFTMDGGDITDNSSEQGGGVFVSGAIPVDNKGAGVFIKNGGTIQNNTLINASSGAQIYVQDTTDNPKSSETNVSTTE